MALTLSSPFVHKNLSIPTLSLTDKFIRGGHEKYSPCTMKNSKVYCNGELVMTTGGTKKEYVVDVWSGNHPFYLSSRSHLLVDADQVEKFGKKFGGLSQIMEIPVLKGDIVLPSKRKSAKGKKK